MTEISNWLYFHACLPAWPGSSFSLGSELCGIQPEAKLLLLLLLL